MDLLIVVGRNPAISLGELTAVFEQPAFLISLEVAGVRNIAGTPAEAIERFRRLGGSVKLGLFDAVVELDRLHNVMTSSLELLLAQQTSGKIQIGVSVYGGTNTLRHGIGKTLLSIKKMAREQGRSLRVVVSKEPTLSSVVVAKNHLLDRGREFLVVETDNGLEFGHTIAVQDFEGQSDRDYGRPRRDPKRGILPVQLARVMVNLGAPRPGAVVLDPFCGIGTILQEALLLGHTVIGSDIDLKAIDDTRENLNWLLSSLRVPTLRSGRSNLSHATSKPTLLVSDIRSLSRRLDGFHIDAIVTELDLGPPVRGSLSLSQVEETRATLLPLYRDAFQTFAQVLKPGCRAVVVLPAWRVDGKTIFAVDDLTTITTLPFTISRFPFTSPDRGTYLYGRPDQHVWREIVVCENIAS